jgi:hypothetical protein
MDVLALTVHKETVDPRDFRNPGSLWVHSDCFSDSKDGTILIRNSGYRYDFAIALMPRPYDVCFITQSKFVSESQNLFRVFF